jgi:hypothetical protein
VYNAIGAVETEFNFSNTNTISSLAVGGSMDRTIIGDGVTAHFNGGFIHNLTVGDQVTLNVNNEYSRYLVRLHKSSSTSVFHFLFSL